MTPILLTPFDIATAASLIVLDAVLSILLKIRLHWQLAIAAARMVVQLVAIGYVLKFIFSLNNPAATLLLVLVMVLVAAREVAARPERRFKGSANFVIGTISVGFATFVTAVLALTTAIRPDPWFNPHYAIPLAGIILGNVLNSASLSLDSLLGSVKRERPAIEARLSLGASYREAIAPLVREAIRRGLLPIINQMSAAGIVTLPGIMTGQILAGLDPIEAVKYQILLMFLLSGGSGLSTLGGVLSDGVAADRRTAAAAAGPAAVALLCRMRKSPPVLAGGRWFDVAASVTDAGDPGTSAGKSPDRPTLHGAEVFRRCLAALAVELRFVGKLLAFVERAHASALDGADVHEHVVAAIVRRDEAKTLCCVEPLDRSGCHFTSPRCAKARCARTTFARA
jgi:putative ABC transport system permease protein